MTDNEILEMAKEADVIVFAKAMRRGSNQDILVQFARLVEARVKEQCAQICDDAEDADNGNVNGYHCAAAIRGSK